MGPASPHEPELREAQRLPEHIEQTIQALADLHAQHERRGSPSQIALRNLISMAARPRSLSAVLLVIAAWAAVNAAMVALGRPAPDPPPFYELDTVLAIASLCVTLTILTIQRREDQLSHLREQLALELAILGEQKNAKIIQLLEELRRDSPAVPDRPDAEAEAMAQPANPREVLDAIEERHAEAGLLDQEVGPRDL
jgi:uncharacterized membrane protein